MAEATTATTVTIRPFRPLDHRACRELWAELTEQHRQLYDDPAFGGHDPGAAFEDYMTRLDLSGMWVAEDSDEGVVGFVGLLLKGRAGQVEPVIVTARRRREGIGRALLGKVAEEARRRGLSQLSVSPTTRNVAAIQMCHDAGYAAMEHLTLTFDLSRRGHDWRDGIDLHERRFLY